MSNQLISVLCPTRKRPSNMERMWESAYRNAKDKENLDCWWYVDDDDLISQEKFKELKEKFGDCQNIVVGQRILMATMTNVLAEKAKGDILWGAGDDITFNTLGWDTLVREAYEYCPDKILMVGGEDEYMRNGFMTHFALSREWVNVTGYFGPDIYSADWSDTTLMEISRNIGRNCIIPIYVEHHHYAIGKGEIDQTMQEKIERGNRDRNELIFINSIDKRIEDAQKLLNYINKINGTELKLKYRRYYP